MAPARRESRPPLPLRATGRVSNGRTSGRRASCKPGCSSALAFHEPSTSPRCPTSSSSGTGSRRADLAAIVEALGKGELDKAYELTSPDVTEKLTIAGTPEECTARIKEIESTGVNHMILCITDPPILKAFAQRDVSVPDAKGQLRLIHDEVMPAFAG